MAIQTASTTITAQDTGRVDLVVKALTEASRSQIRGMIDHGCVKINGAPCDSDTAHVVVGDVIEVRYDNARRYREMKKRRHDRTFTIVFEDEHLIVVDKAAGALTVPTDRGETNTLVEGVSQYIKHVQGQQRAWLVHRLDRDVSGLLVFAKHEPVAERLIEQFKAHKPQRVYTAIVAGLLLRDEGRIESHLATGKNLDRYSTRPSNRTEVATTRFRVLERLADTTLVEVELETGRRNQIRVHLAECGHPVLGDPRYQKKLARHPDWTSKRLALHARSLGFEHPVNGTPMAFESALPARLQKFLTRHQRGPAV